jgi:hypothetical protein
MGFTIFFFAAVGSFNFIFVLAGKHSSLLPCRGGSSGIAGWTVSNNGDVAAISIIVAAAAAHLQQYWLQKGVLKVICGG